MKTSDIGEFGLIGRLEQFTKTNDPRIIKGIGDDAAVLAFSEKEYQLITTDILIEDVHFKCDWISPFDLGWKSMAVNVSDIAAMGGHPTFAVISLAVPEGIEVEYIEDIYRGMAECCSRYHLSIVGGDTSGSKSGIVINVALQGSVLKNEVKYRSGARAGDFIYVSGYLGDSAAGLACLMAGLKDSADSAIRYDINCHNKPTPRVELAQVLVKNFNITAMIDISDGLSSDLNHICVESGTGALVTQKMLPVSSEILKVAEILNIDVWKWVLSGGEDYELLFTSPDGDLPLDIAGIRVARIGEILEGNKVYIEIPLEAQKNRRVELPPRGYVHF